ncbi:hypothetical protein P872_09105 [Rhodonellum psychrophilum GCM71 = DSM 17998]|uniref:Uncharacterized protein n=1 Tax=Rhodonellum psychrophilum GCM71 = DSM 17998 TaxID=1123057 RepID=U5BZA5_9BACT|nr:hypothetical protein P872_09105 [Rhodonellum psychrophilum GCM71 = DSM 17998]
MVFLGEFKKKSDILTSTYSTINGPKPIVVSPFSTKFLKYRCTKKGKDNAPENNNQETIIERPNFTILIFLTAPSHFCGTQNLRVAPLPFMVEFQILTKRQNA